MEAKVEQHAMWCIPHLLRGNDMKNEVMPNISGMIMSKVLAQAVISQAASRCPTHQVSRPRRGAVPGFRHSDRRE